MQNSHTNAAIDVLGRIDSVGRDFPACVAHSSSGRSLTYGELLEKSESLADYLAANLPDNRSPVAVLGHKEPEMLIAFLAAVKSGHPYLPLDASMPSQRIKGILADSGAALTLTPSTIPGLLEKSASSSTPRPPRGRVGINDPFYIIYTSGSTGAPKGAVITLGNLTHFVSWVLAEHQFTERGEVFLNQAPFSFDLSVMDLYGALATGGTLFSITKAMSADPVALREALAGSGVTTWVSTPSFVRLCLAEESFAEKKLGSLRRFLFCGETLPPETAAQLFDRFPRAAIWNLYGPTETTVAVSSVQLDREMLAFEKPLPVGRAMPGVEIAIIDDAGETVAEGERGEIIIAGPAVSAGYLSRPELTAKVFFSRNGQPAYRTGDCGSIEAGMLFLEGRIDRQIKIRGFRVEPGEIESALIRLAGVRQSAVMVRQTSSGEKRLVAYLVGKGIPPRRALHRMLAQELPDYMIPTAYVVLNSLPLTANGKLDRDSLPAPDRASSEEVVPASDPLQARLVELWERILDVRPVGIEDSFFELGGDSLCVVELTCRIEETFGRKIPVSAILAAPTITGLSALIENPEVQTEPSVIDELRATGSNPPLFFTPGYIDLARHLGNDHPFYGMRLEALEGLAKSPTAVDDLAELCAQEIQRVQPRGPYFLGGHSSGAVLAFAVAQRLWRDGKRIALLALIDPDPVRPLDAISVSHANRYVFHFRKLMECPPRDRVSYLIRGMRQESARWLARMKNIKPIEAQVPPAEAIIQRYRPSTYPGRITILLAKDTHRRVRPEDDPRLDWEGVAGRGLNVHEIAGDHYTCITEPNVSRLAIQLRGLLNAPSVPPDLARAATSRIPEIGSTLMTALSLLAP